MERQIQVRMGMRPKEAGLLFSALAGLLISACNSEPEVATRQIRSEQTAWIEPASLESALFTGDSLVLKGVAAPGDRIVLTDLDGVSVASSTDADGTFTIRLHPDAVTLHHTEIHSRGNDARAGEWLVVAPGVQPVAAVLTPGGAALPLQRRGMLTAIDYDGAAVLVSGVAEPGEAVRVTLDGGLAQTPVPGPTGRYVARFATTPPGLRQFRVEMGGRTQEVTLTLSAPTDTLNAMSSGLGVRIDWPTPGGGAQSTWILDSPSVER